MNIFLTSYFCESESSSLIWFVVLREEEMINIEEMWQQFHLIEEEVSKINVDEKCLTAETKRGNEVLLGNCVQIESLAKRSYI